MAPIKEEGGMMDVIHKTLVVVEDEPLIAMMIEEMVADGGWQPIGLALNEQEALAMIGTYRPDAALLDIVLGKSTSMAVAAFCRNLHIPIIFVTGLAANDLPLECGEAPVLAKPFSSDELIRALESLH
jgi:CheY-like chemotaxis protein